MGKCIDLADCWSQKKLIKRPKDESTRLENKIKKIKRFWSKDSLLIPNVFRLVRSIPQNNKQILEYLDLSKKELLGRYPFNWSPVERAEGVGQTVEERNASSPETFQRDFFILKNQE